MPSTNLTYITGDIFAAPPNTILVHACNTVGSWGAGIALAFQSKYPEAFELYKAYCNVHSNEELIGTCLVIRGETAAAGGKGHDIACLFTSRAYGKRKDAKEDILNATRNAVKDLLSQNTERKPLHACRINSGRFAVPWESTAAILDELGAEMVVYNDPIDPKIR